MVIIVYYILCFTDLFENFRNVLANFLSTFVNMAIKRSNYSIYNFPLILMLITGEIYRKGQRQNTENILSVLLTIVFHVDKQLIFGCQMLMTFYVINQLLRSKPAYCLIIYSIRIWFPLEIKQMLLIGFLPKS